MNWLRCMWTILRCAFTRPNQPAVIDWETGRLAEYVRLSSNPVARTVDAFEGRVWLDVDANGELIGVEVLK